MKKQLQLNKKKIIRQEGADEVTAATFIQLQSLLCLQKLVPTLPMQSLTQQLLGQS